MPKTYCSSLVYAEPRPLAPLFWLCCLLPGHPGAHRDARGRKRARIRRRPGVRQEVRCDLNWGYAEGPLKAGEAHSSDDRQESVDSALRAAAREALPCLRVYALTLGAGTPLRRRVEKVTERLERELGMEEEG